MRARALARLAARPPGRRHHSQGALRRRAQLPPPTAPGCAGDICRGCRRGLLRVTRSRGPEPRGSAPPGTRCGCCTPAWITLSWFALPYQPYPPGNPPISEAARGAQVWGEHAEVTADLLLSHFLFSLPLDAPPSFATQLVALRWLLRFELTTSVAAPAGGWLAGGGRAPEKISWALPILVRPPSGA